MRSVAKYQREMRHFHSIRHSGGAIRHLPGRFAIYNI